MEKPLLKKNEVAGGINVIIDDRFVAIFSIEYQAQVEHLINSTNLAHEQRIEKLNK